MTQEDDEAPNEIVEASEGGEGSFDSDGDEDSGGNKLILIIGGALLLLVGGGAAAFFTGALDGLLGKSSECVEKIDEDGEVIEACPEEEMSKDKASKDKDKKKAKKDGKEGKGGLGNFLEIPTMIVNLNTGSDTPRYLRLTVQLELNNSEDVAAVEAVMPRVVDQFQTYLRELRVRDLRGSAGIYRLQMELLWRVNQAAAPVEVKDVLFQEILIQ
ncbi:MAG: flagellar basal body-associated FliL family protein [Bdellovibrionales bacterium]